MTDGRAASVNDGDVPLALRLVPHALVASMGYVVFVVAGLPELLTTRLDIGLAAFALLTSAPLGAFVLDPDLLLLDEPSAGLAPDLVDEMFDRIDEINDDGTAIMMVEQNAKEALRRCDRGYVLVNGENAFEGPGNELLGDQEVRERFLGG